jgi:hypothetical protein
LIKTGQQEFLKKPAQTWDYIKSEEAVPVVAVS